MANTDLMRVFSVLLLIAAIALVAEAAFQSISGEPHAHSVRDNEPAAVQPRELPGLVLEVCAGCELDPYMQQHLLDLYATSAVDMGYVVNTMKPVVLRISETGLLANGSPYLVGMVANVPFRVGDPYPGESIVSVAVKLVLRMMTTCPHSREIFRAAQIGPEGLCSRE